MLDEKRIYRSFKRQYFSALSQIWVADALYELVFVEETRKTLNRLEVEDNEIPEDLWYVLNCSQVSLLLLRSDSPKIGSTLSPPPGSLGPIITAE